VRGASPVRLVICLYEQAIEDLRRASAAHNRGHIEERTRHINHAILVLGHLQSSLDMDQGGQVAANLERFYNQVRNGLIEAQRRQSAAALENQITLLMVVYEAWCEVERGDTIAMAKSSSSVSSFSSAATPSGPVSVSGQASLIPASFAPASFAPVSSASPSSGRAFSDRELSAAEAEPHSSADWSA